MAPTALLMDKMGNDTEGIVVLFLGLATLFMLVWLGGFLVKFLRAKTQKSNQEKIRVKDTASS